MPTFIALPPNRDFERVQRALEWTHNNKGNWPNAEARWFRPLGSLGWLLEMTSRATSSSANSMIWPAISSSNPSDRRLKKTSGRMKSLNLGASAAPRIAQAASQSYVSNVGASRCSS